MSKVGIIRGTFKMIVPSHSLLIEEASSFVDKLIVFIDDDELIKTQGRKPVMTSLERSIVLRSIKGVSGVVVFSGEEDFLDKVKFWSEDYKRGNRVYFKGGDYSPKNLKEAEELKKLGFVICCLTYHEHRHTQDILNAYTKG